MRRAGKLRDGMSILRHAPKNKREIFLGMSGSNTRLKSVYMIRVKKGGDIPKARTLKLERLKLGRNSANCELAKHVNRAPSANKNPRRKQKSIARVRLARYQLLVPIRWWKAHFRAVQPLPQTHFRRFGVVTLW
jgi:hypothetical protein